MVIAKQKVQPVRQHKDLFSSGIQSSWRACIFTTNISSSTNTISSNTDAVSSNNTITKN